MEKKRRGLLSRKVSWPRDETVLMMRERGQEYPPYYAGASKKKKRRSETLTRAKRNRGRGPLLAKRKKLSRKEKTSGRSGKTGERRREHKIQATNNSGDGSLEMGRDRSPILGSQSTLSKPKEKKEFDN